MLGVDDALDDAHWANVQDPIKQMFLALTKAIRSQAAGIRDLDRKCSEYMTRDMATHLVRESFDKACSKQDATQIIYKVDSKASEKSVELLESQLQHAHSTISKLEEKIQDQTLAMGEMNARIDHMERDLMALKNPTYEQVFSYIDRQLGQVVADMDRKLEVKADMRYVNSALPERLENLYRDMNNKMNDMTVALRKTATKDEFQALANEKANGSELRGLAADISDRTTRQELHQAINNHIKPLTVALTSLEKALQVQDSISKGAAEVLSQKTEKLEHMLKEEAEYRMRTAVNSSGSAPCSVDYVHRIIDEVVRERKLGEVTQMVLDSTMSRHTDDMLKHMSILSESIRLELVTTTREELSIAAGKVKEMSDYVQGISRDIDEKQTTVRGAVKELSMNVSKALSKKLDIRDFKKIMKNKQGEFSRLVYDSTGSGSDGGGLPRGRYRNSVNDGRQLIGRSQDDNFNHASDTSAEFDYLMSSMKKDDSSVGIAGADIDGNYSVGEMKSNRSRSTSPQRAKSPARGRGTTVIPPPEKTRHNTSSGELSKIVDRLADQLNLQQKELNTIRETQRVHSQQLSSRSPSKVPSQPSHVVASMEELAKLDWRLAVGEMGMNLRREMADKVSREEMFSALRMEMDSTEKRLHALQQGLDKAALATDLSQVDNQVTTLKHKVAGELTGARFLWTSGTLINDGYVPWDVQVVNAAPAIITWKKGTSAIAVRVPGLYRLCVCIFTSVPAVVHVYLNDEPMFSYQPDAAHNPNKPAVVAGASQKSDRFFLRRMRHSAGEVSCLCIEEYVSLPPEAQLSVRYYSAIPAQGFIALRKL